MVRLFFPLGLIPVLLSGQLRTVSGATLDQLFIIASGSTNGGCDAYFDQNTKEGTLDKWLEELDYSTEVAFNAFENYKTDDRIKSALFTFFGIPIVQTPDAQEQAAIDHISGNIDKVRDFVGLALAKDGNGGLEYPLKDDRYLFCDSEWLLPQTPDNNALDFEGREIKDGEGDLVPLSQLQAYKDGIAEVKGNKAYWTGDFSPMNGYYFSTTGSGYCDVVNKDGSKNYGLTSDIKLLDGKGNVTPNRVSVVTLCDAAFTATVFQPDFRTANQMTQEGTKLRNVMPRSATLLHEMFHVIFGAYAEPKKDDPESGNPTGFLETGEIYEILKCIDLAKKNPAKAQRNPESYVYFIIQMYYLFGVPDGQEGTSIDTNWDFTVIWKGNGRSYSAIATKQMSPPST